MAFQLGKTIGGYEFLEELETKSAGLTFKVRNEIAGRLEVLKVLSRELRDDHERVQRFLREVKIHERLSHPNLAAFYGAFEIEGQMVMTLELVEGEALAKKVKHGPLPLDEVLASAIQALSALEYAHANEVVHRNLSPSCLIVGRDGVVKVTDFDLAKASNDPRLTLTGTVLGPMYYIAPEQVKGETALDARTDIYSLGMILYEALTGQKAFASSSQFEVMQAHVHAMPPSPSEIRLGLPAALDQAVLTAVAKERDARFGNARQFREALERVQSAPVAVGAPPAMAAAVAAAVPAAARQPVETPLPDQIVETWVSEKSSPAAAPAAQETALGTAPQTRAPGRVTIQELLYDDGRLDPRVVGLITFVVTLVICFGVLAIVR